MRTWHSVALFFGEAHNEVVHFRIRMRLAAKVYDPLANERLQIMFAKLEQTYQNKFAELASEWNHFPSRSSMS